MLIERDTFMMSNDFYFPMVDARARLAGSRYVIETLIEALEATGCNSIPTEVALSLGKTELEEIANILDKEIA